MWSLPVVIVRRRTWKTLLALVEDYGLFLENERKYSQELKTALSKARIEIHALNEDDIRA